MRAYVLTVCRWFGRPPRELLELFTPDEIDCLVTEALVNRAVRL